MTPECQDIANLGSHGLEQMTCEAVPKGMCSGSLGESCLTNRFFNCPLYMGLMKVKPPPLAFFWNGGQKFRGKKPLPDELLGCIPDRLRGTMERGLLQNSYEALCHREPTIAGFSAGPTTARPIASGLTI